MDIDDVDSIINTISIGIHFQHHIDITSLFLMQYYCNIEMTSHNLVYAIWIILCIILWYCIIIISHWYHISYIILRCILIVLVTAIKGHNGKISLSLSMNVCNYSSIPIPPLRMGGVALLLYLPCSSWYWQAHSPKYPHLEVQARCMGFPTQVPAISYKCKWPVPTSW